MKFNSVDERIADFAHVWHEMGEDNDLVIRNEKLMAYLNSGGFFTAPASTKYHGAYEGGLYDHSRTVAMRLFELTLNNGLKWKRPESPFIVGMFHDLCKCDQYKLVHNDQPTINGKSAVWESHYEYETNTLLKGHGSKSIMILSQFITLTEEEMLCIRYHMSAYEKDDWQELDMAIKRCPNILFAHLSDMLASKIDGM